jgi:hypothetical protein
VPNVVYTPDPAHGGQSAPGLAGRLYLFGPEIDVPMAGDGSLIVDLYDVTQNPSAPVIMERWNIDKDTLKRLLKRDTIGWGYTLFLPWGSFRPDVTRVLLKARYDPLRGTPLYADSAPMTLANAAVPPPVSAPAGMPLAQLAPTPGGGSPPAGVQQAAHH